MTTLKDKIAIVTGGGSGIGRGISLALAKSGVRVVVCGRRKENLDQTIQDIWEAGGGGLAVQTDVSDVGDVKRLVNQVIERYQTIDYLINNAGINGGAPIHQQSVEEWDRVMATNLRGPFLTSRAVLPVLRAKGSGHIINISSESGIEYYPGNGVYGVAKHALNALGEFIQRENQEYNIRVDTICPGMVISEMTENEPDLNPERCLTPDDIADLVLWLLSCRANIKIGTPILIQTMLNPWNADGE
jgi:NAD(P)-dependent dehydrogenase (short-subunit alcohol dehydrogenase family)